MILTLIRHGQTDLGLERKYCGWLDVPLNDEGKHQSEKLAERFLGFGCDPVYSSDLKRAVQTAEIVFKDKEIYEKPCFREMGFGILEGLSYEEAISQYPDLYNDWINDPWSTTLAKGEAFNDFRTRVLQGLNDLLTQVQDNSIVVVSHSGPIRVILCEVMNRDIKDFWSIEQDNAAVNIIEFHSSLKPKIIIQNDTEHLKILQKASR